MAVVVGECIGHVPGSPIALTVIAANSARVRSLSGQKALGAQPLTMPSAASRLIAFWNLLFPSSLKKSFVVGRKAHHTMEEGGRLTSGDGSVRAGQAVPASEEKPSGMQFGEGGPEEARVVVL